MVSRLRKGQGEKVREVFFLLSMVQEKQSPDQRDWSVVEAHALLDGGWAWVHLRENLSRMRVERTAQTEG